MILSRLGVNAFVVSDNESTKKYFSESITYSVSNQPVAETGKLSGNCLAKFDIGQDVFYSHMDWDLIMKIIKNNTISYTELPKFPSVRRDLAMLLDKGIKFGHIREIAFRTEKNVLREIGLFDVYESESLGANKKSYAVSFILRDNIRTMTDKNIEKTMNNLIKAFETELGAKIR